MLLLPAELTHRQARGTLAMLQQSMAGRGRSGAGGAAQLVVDARPLQVFDSSALAVLLECRRAAVEQGQAFAVKGLPPALAGLAVLYGVAPLLPATA